MRKAALWCTTGDKIAADIAEALQVAYDEEVDLSIVLPTVGLDNLFLALAAPKPKYAPKIADILDRYQEYLLAMALPHIGGDEVATATHVLRSHREDRRVREHTRWADTLKAAELPYQRSKCNMMLMLLSGHTQAYRLMLATKQLLDLEEGQDTGMAALHNLEEWMQKELSNA